MKLKPFHSRAAFTLVEVAVALGIASFCLLAVFGLLPVGINSNTASVEQTAAAGMARAIISDLRAAQITSPAAAKSTIFQISIPAAAGGVKNVVVFLREDGSVAQSATTYDYTQNADPTQNPRYRALLTFTPPTTAAGRTATTARIFVTWPALADQKVTPAAPVNFSGSYEVLTALDRN